jgi:hypothetical protein
MRLPRATPPNPWRGVHIAGSACQRRLRGSKSSTGAIVVPPDVNSSPPKRLAYRHRGRGKTAACVGPGPAIAPSGSAVGRSAQPRPDYGRRSDHRTHRRHHWPPRRLCAHAQPASAWPYPSAALRCHRPRASVQHPPPQPHRCRWRRAFRSAQPARLPRAGSVSATATASGGWRVVALQGGGYRAETRIRVATVDIERPPNAVTAG